MSLLTIGECLSKTAIRSLLSQLVKAHETGKILGIAQSAASLGTIVGPALGGFVFVVMGKDFPFFNGAILMLVATVLCLSIIKQIRSELRTRGKDREATRTAIH